ncbi:MAG: hypothetical protein PHU25_02850 [Deltaproteobacteria bacterium]|nr:hypothetical protein [Deltaproteobacteria bacterium]
MTRIAALAAIPLAAMVLFSACSRKALAPSPADTARELLALHGLVGRQPEDRSEADRKRPVDRKALTALFSDYATTDPFLADLYVGFLVGALARNQGDLRVTVQGKRAVVQAGKLGVALELRERTWLISLAASVPDGIKRRALEEKVRYENARAAGQAVR